MIATSDEHFRVRRSRRRRTPTWRLRPTLCNDESVIYEGNALKEEVGPSASSLSSDQTTKEAITGSTLHSSRSETSTSPEVLFTEQGQQENFSLVSIALSQNDSETRIEPFDNVFVRSKSSASGKSHSPDLVADLCRLAGGRNKHHIMRMNLASPTCSSGPIKSFDDLNSQTPTFSARDRRTPSHWRHVTELCMRANQRASDAEPKPKAKRRRNSRLERIATAAPIDSMDVMELLDENSPNALARGRHSLAISTECSRSFKVRISRGQLLLRLVEAKRRVKDSINRSPTSLPETCPIDGDDSKHVRRSEQRAFPDVSLSGVEDDFVLVVYTTAVEGPSFWLRRRSLLSTPTLNTLKHFDETGMSTISGAIQTWLQNRKFEPVNNWYRAATSAEENMKRNSVSLILNLHG